MNPEIQHLDVIDLISERHGKLRKLAEDLWNDNSNIYISNSEWYIMSRIYKKQPTIAYVSKNVDISRQATHKFIKSLEAKGLVEISNVENNKKDKRLQLTPFGEECYEKNESLKATIINKIVNQIGAEKLVQLKEILRLDWGV
ncbi:MarR family winged helix-turn-helix transcriptional regulator [Neobacillus dielmonensis]|uniref:MarR family winged helix-turn-helix transcriptional regulator n=1 Tax=Neobacillus dielmonensis TaxID=1347369 RepID=UPI0005A6D869|nr:MarR family winged helix-turn-helix transcriptional regulator [Neobacillus dielmonensis]